MIRDIDDVRNRLMQAWFDFEQDIMDAVIDKWRDCLRSCSEMNVYYRQHCAKRKSAGI